VVEAVDRVGSAGSAAEMKIAADVVVLVKCGENPLGLGAVEAKINEARRGVRARPQGPDIFRQFREGSSLQIHTYAPESL